MTKRKILRALVELAALGNVRTQTMAAHLDKEFDAIAE
jgi:uncharacterized protein with GYD domain